MKEGKTLWLYNTGMDRFSWGFYNWRARSEGRWEWHFCWPDDAAHGGYPGREWYNPFTAVHGFAPYAPPADYPGGMLFQSKFLDVSEGITDYAYLITLNKAIQAAATRRQTCGGRERSEGVSGGAGPGDPGVAGRKGIGERGRRGVGRHGRERRRPLKGAAMARPHRAIVESIEIRNDFPNKASRRVYPAGTSPPAGPRGGWKGLLSRVVYEVLYIGGLSAFPRRCRRHGRGRRSTYSTHFASDIGTHRRR